MTRYLYDTYALIEIIEGNPDYASYTEEEMVINTFIFAEACYNLIKTDHPKKDDYLEKFKEFIVSLNPRLIKEAMEFRYRNKKKDMSMTDCISYLQAKELGIKFLTGDKEFEDLESVEFVK